MTGVDTTGGYATCAHQGCGDKPYARNLCRRHYDRDRDKHRHRHRDDTLLRTRARNRAVARLIDLHTDEFADIYAEEREKVQAEADALEETRSMVHGPSTERPASAALAAPSKHANAPRVRLISGPKPADQQLADRIRTDVGRCSKCQTYHDAGHRCPECAAPKEGTA